LPPSAFDRDQIVAYSLRSRAIKRKTDHDQQAYSYTTWRAAGRCSEYQVSLPLLGGRLQTQHGDSGKGGVSESVAAAAYAVLGYIESAEQSRTAEQNKISKLTVKLQIISTENDCRM